jgi:hypothetical protein
LAHPRHFNQQLPGFAAERLEFDPLGPTQIALFVPDGFVGPSVGLVQELAVRGGMPSRSWAIARNTRHQNWRVY